jgi:hypothetical protein
MFFTLSRHQCGHASKHRCLQPSSFWRSSQHNSKPFTERWYQQSTTTSRLPIKDEFMLSCRQNIKKLEH